MCRTNIKFPTLIGSVGGWVFVVDVTRGSVGKFILVRHISKLIKEPIRQAKLRVFEDVIRSRLLAGVFGGALCF